MYPHTSLPERVLSLFIICYYLFNLRPSYHAAPCPAGKVVGCQTLPSLVSAHADSCCQQQAAQQQQQPPLLPLLPAAAAAVQQQEVLLLLGGHLLEV